MDKSWVLNMKYDRTLYWPLGRKCNFDCKCCFSNQPNRNDNFLRRMLYGFSSTENKRPGRTSLLDSDKIPAWLASMGGVSRIDFSGGEPFLCRDFVEVCVKITRKHFVGINTNFVLPQVSEFAQRNDPSRVVLVNASLHFDQLKKHNLIGKYIDNYNLYKSKGFNIISSMVAYPGIRGHIQEYREYFEQHGISFQCRRFWGWYHNRWYPEAYSKEDIELYRLNDYPLDNPSKLCNAGYNVCVVNLNNQITPCYSINRKVGTLYSPIHWGSGLVKCDIKNCSCPFYFHEKELFDRSLEETSVNNDV